MFHTSKKRIDKIFEAMGSKTILVIGDLMLDEYIWGQVERISPEAPVPVVNVTRQDVKLGGCGNVAKNLGSLGSGVIMSSVIGDDMHGRIIVDLLERQGISTDHIIKTPERQTIVKTRIIAHTQQVVRIDKEDRSRVTGDIHASIISGLMDSMDMVDAVLISDYGKGIVNPDLIAEVVRTAKKRGIFVSVDPKERDFPFYKDVGLITPNTKELGYGAGMPIESDNDVSEAVEKIRKMLNPDMVLVTRGSQGMSLFEKDALTHIPTAARKVFDVTGAGDTVIACFTLCMAAGATPQEATLISNAAAGMVVAELGAASAPWEGLKSICMEATHG